MSEFLSKSAFAERQGWSPSYVTKLKDAGRLVLNDKGQVDVEASLKRIEETADPNRDDVRARHAKARVEKRTVVETPPEDHDKGREDEETPTSFTAARAKKEHYLALSAQLEYERAAGKSVDASAVEAAGSEVGAVLRSIIENMSDQLTPVLASVTDEEEVRRILDDHGEVILNEISAKLAALSEQKPGST